MVGQKVMDLNHGIGLLSSRHMMNLMLEQGVTNPDVLELIKLGLARCDADDALKARMAEHEAAYVATLPVVKFQTYESVYSGDGDPEPNVNYGVYEARTDKEAVALARAAGETSVTHARMLR